MSTPTQPELPPLFKDPLPLDDTNLKRLPVYYKEMRNHVADIMMRIGSRGALGAGLSALYTTFPLMGLPQVTRMVEDEPGFVAFAMPACWGMNPLWWAANRADPAVIASVMYHEADHIVNNDALNTIKMVKRLAKQGVRAHSFSPDKPDPVTGDWKDTNLYSLEAAAYWVRAYENKMLDLFCDETYGISRDAQENLDIKMLNAHQRRMVDQVTKMCEQAHDMSGIELDTDTRARLDQLAQFTRAPGTSRNYQRADFIADFAATLPLINIPQPGSGGAGDEQGESGMSVPGDDGEPGMGDVRSDTPGDADGRGEPKEADGDGKSAAEKLAEQAGSLTDDDIDRLSREHDTKMETAARMAGDSPLFNAFKLRTMEAASRDYKSILAEGLTLSAYSRDGKKSLARPYLPDLSRRMIRPTAKGEPTVQALAMLDTSGSMYWGSVGAGGESEATTAVREMLAVIRTTPLDYLVVLPCDSVVHTPLVLERDMSDADGDQMAQDLTNMMVEGGGGTSFSPPFKWLDSPPAKHRDMVRQWSDASEGGPPFSACIYYTDGDGHLPDVATVMRVQKFWGGAGHLYWCMPKSSRIGSTIRQNSSVYGRALWMG